MPRVHQKEELVVIPTTVSDFFDLLRDVERNLARFFEAVHDRS